MKDPRVELVAAMDSLRNLAKEWIQIVSKIIFKGSSDPSHFIKEIHAGKSRLTTYNDSEFESTTDF